MCIFFFWSLYWICYNIASVLCFGFFGCKACEILAPWLGIKPAPPALKGEVLTTGPPGKSWDFFPAIEVSSFYCWIAYCSFQFCQFCFTYSRALLLHVYTFVMCIFSWYSDSSIIIRCLSLSLVIFLVFMSLLSGINIAIPALYDYCVHSWLPFLRSLTQLIPKGEPRVPHD